MTSVRRGLPAALAVLALAGVGVGAAVSRPPAPGATPTAVAATAGPAVRDRLLCPDLRQIPGTLQAGVVVGTSTPGAGSVTVTPATGTATVPPTTVLRPGTALGTYVPPAAGPVVLQSTGQPTAGLVAEQIARGNKTTDRGWAEARCEPARTDQWFVGAATEPGDTPTVVLANPGDTRAIVTVTVLTPAGLVAAPAGSNLVLAPHAPPTFLPLVDLAPGVTVTAVEVKTTTGLVSAAVRDVRTNGQTLLGTDYVPVGEPGTALTLPGLPGTVTGAPPARTLFIGVPGTDGATVRVTVTTAQGSYVPAGLNAVDVAPQSVKAVPLGAVLGTQPATVTVTSQPGAAGVPPPVVAGVLIDAASTQPAGRGIHEIAYLGPVAPVQGTALIPTVRDPAGTGTDSVIVASAPRAGARLTLTVDPPTGPPRIFVRTIPAGTTIAVSMLALRVPDTSSVTVSLAPGPGPVFVTRLIEESGALGPLLSAFEVQGAPPLQPIPAVAPGAVGQH